MDIITSQKFVFYGRSVVTFGPVHDSYWKVCESNPSCGINTIPPQQELYTVKNRGICGAFHRKGTGSLPSRLSVILICWIQFVHCTRLFHVKIFRH